MHSQYTSLHYTALHCTALHYTTLHHTYVTEAVRYEDLLRFESAVHFIRESVAVVSHLLLQLQNELVENMKEEVLLDEMR